MSVARRVRPLAVCVAVVTLPSVARAEVFWKGDFETGDLKQWTYLLNESGLAVVDSPTAEGKHAARITITKNDLWSNGLNRVELQYTPPSTHNTAGTEIYFGYSIYVPELLSTDSHQIGYWETSSSYQQLFHVAAMGSRVALRTQKPSYKEQWALDGLLTPQVWHRIVWHIRWSTDATAGTLDLWWDGTQRVTGLKVQTYLDNPPFTQLGILRDTIDQVEVMYVDDARAGTTYEDVKGALPSAAGGGGAGGSAGASGAGGSTGGATEQGGTSGSAPGGSASGGVAPMAGSGPGGAATAGSPTAGTGAIPSGSGGTPLGMGGNPSSGGGQAPAAATPQPAARSSCAVAAPAPDSPNVWALGLAAIASFRRRRRSGSPC